MDYKIDYRESLEAPDSFWKKQAEGIEWYTFPSKILSKKDDNFYKWYEGGVLNTAYLCCDVHVKNGRGEQVAIYYDSPVTNTKQAITYNELTHQVAKTAGMLQQLGVTKGDRVIIYMPMIPQVVYAMLACARIGAVHSVVFGGFAAHELAIRIDDASPKVILAASAGKEIEKIIPYKPIIDAAMAEAKHKVAACVVWQRDFLRATLNEGLDYDWTSLLSNAPKADCVPVDATDPLYILYTSGTTGKPKGIVRDNGGHAVAMKYSLEKIYGIEPGDVYWAASDVGWVVGHSYIVYAPLITGCSTILYEGKPIKTPDAGAFFRVIQDYKVKVFFTAPTAFRAVKKEDAEGLLAKQYDTSSLERVFLAGERCDVATYNWVKELLSVPVIDHWWQTESGWPIIANQAGYGLIESKPGSVTLPVCGYDVQILSAKGVPMKANEEGAVAIKLPLPPGMLPTLWKNDERYVKSYLSVFKGFYLAGDGGYKDEDGYIYITGRIDDIINVAGHRLSTVEMEEVVASHPAVAECCVVGVHDALKGQVPMGLMVLKQGVQIEEIQLVKEVIGMVRNTIGPVAAFKTALVAQRLPKTRSGKILRKIIRAIADNKTYNTPSTIEDITVLGEIKDLFETKGIL